MSGASPYETGCLQVLQVDRVSRGSSFRGAWRSRRTETSGPRCLPVFIKYNGEEVGDGEQDDIDHDYVDHDDDDHINPKFLLKIIYFSK